MIVENADIVAADLGEGVGRKIMASDGGMMTVQFDFQEGSIGHLQMGVDAISHDDFKVWTVQ